MSSFRFRSATVIIALIMGFVSSIATPTQAIADPLSPAALAASATITAARASIADLQTSIDADTEQLKDARLIQAIANDNVTTSEAADTSAVQASSCRTMSHVQAAMAGGLALKPAPYGITYISIAALLVPLFFPNCNATSAPDSTTTTTAKVAKSTAETQVKQLQLSITAKTSQLLEQYKVLTSALSQSLTAK